MKRFRYVFLTIVIMVCLCVTVSAADYTWRSPEDTYSLYLTENDDGTLTVSGYGDYAAVETIDVLTIPDEVEGKAVTAIGNRAFSVMSVSGKIQPRHTQPCLIYRIIVQRITI